MPTATGTNAEAPVREKYAAFDSYSDTLAENLSRFFPFPDESGCQ
jgi:hypothetical protein